MSFELYSMSDHMIMKDKYIQNLVQGILSYEISKYHDSAMCVEENALSSYTLSLFSMALTIMIAM